LLISIPTLRLQRIWGRELKLAEKSFPKSHVVRSSFWGGSSIQGVGLGGLHIPPFEMESSTDVKTEMSPVLACLLIFLVGCSGCQHHTCRCVGRVFICQESKVVQVPRDIPANATEL